MISEADPTLLAELCGTLLRHNEAPPPTATTTKAPSNAQTHAQALAQASRRKAAGVGPLRYRSVNSTTPVSATSSPRVSSSSSSSPSSLCSSSSSLVKGGVRPVGAGAMVIAGCGRSTVAVAAVAGTARAAAMARVGVGLGAGEAGAGAGTGVGGKGPRRKMCTPTKASVGGRVPERKTTRKVSPQKGVPKAVAPPKLALSEDQRRAVELVAEGKSVFFTGESWGEEAGWGGSGGKRGEGGKRVGGGARRSGGGVEEAGLGTGWRVGLGAGGGRAGPCGSYQQCYSIAPC